MSKRWRARASTSSGRKPWGRLSGSSHPLLAILLVLSLAWPALAVSARINRSPADPFVVPPSAEDSYAPETLTWRQRTAEEWATGAFEQTAYTAGNGVALTRAVFKLAHAGDYDDKVRGTSAMVAFDADADGDADLVLANSPWRTPSEMLLNDGAGDFFESAAGALNHLPTDSPLALIAFDADGDGDDDLAVGSDSSYSDHSVLLLNDGFGMFTLADAGAFEDASCISDGLLPFDADGDGDVDLAVTGGYPRNVLYLNDGAGRFSVLASGDFYGSPEGPLAALDADRDGDLDVALPGRLYRNDGAGILNLSLAGDFDSAAGNDLVAFDADSDGDDDLAVPGALFLNNGAGNFMLTPAGAFSNSTGYRLLAFDADGDGDPDLAVERGSPLPNAVYANDGSGVFAQGDAGAFDDEPMYMTALVALDADGDGLLDLALSQHQRSYFFHNQGGARFDLADAGALSNEARQTKVIAAFDANGDAAADLAIGGSPNALFLNDGAGDFIRSDAGDYLNAGHVVALAPFDADGDGDIDLATGNSLDSGGETNRLLLNDGAGRLVFAEAGDFDDPVVGTLALAAFDADGDGDVDLAVGNVGSAANALYLNDGAGMFDQAEAGDFDDAGSAALIAFDADGDGDLDLAAGGFGDSIRALLLNTGAGQFTLTDSGSFGTALAHNSPLVPFDADGDGDVDVAVPHRIFLNDGQGRFSNHGFGSGWNYEALVALDYDNDGDGDLATGPPMANAYPRLDDCLFANDGAGNFTPVPAGDPDLKEPDIVAMVAVDADVDGDLDLVRHGRLFAYQNLHEAGSVTSPVVDPSQLYPTSGHLVGWQHLAVQELLPANTDVRYDILDAATGETIPGFADLQPDAAGQISLAGINPSSHPAIRLRARLMDTHAGSDYLDASPHLYEWSVAFSMAAEMPPPRIANAYRINTPPVVDGNLTDWPAQPAEIELTLHTAETVLTQPAGSPPPQPGDSSALLWAAWTEDALYLAIHVRDDVIVVDSGDVWRDDEIELAFDGLRDLQPLGQDDHQYTVNPDGRLTDHGDPGSHPSIQVGVRPVAGGWDVEARIPAARLHAGALHLAKDFGFSLGLHDDDDGGNWDSYLIWEGSNTMNAPGGFGLLHLSGPYATPTWWQRAFGDWYESELSHTVIDRPAVQPVDAGQFSNCPASAILAFDADSDDDLDLAGLGALCKNDGAGSFTLADAGDFDGQTGYALALLDADGDCDGDLALTGSTPSNRLFLNDGTGAFTLADAGEFSQHTGSRLLLAFDSDGDADVDLAVGSQLYFNDGTGVYTLANGYPFAWSGAEAMAALDVDEDGDLDVVVGSSGVHNNPCYYDDEHNWICRMYPNAFFGNDGAGVFTRVPVHVFEPYWPYSHFTEHLATFDADGDGDADLMSGNFGYCQEYPTHPGGCGSMSDLLFVNDGANFSDSPKWVGSGLTTGLAVLDVDGDGITDVAMTRADENPQGWPIRTANSVHRNDGLANFNSISAGAFATSGTGPPVGLDANGDGLDDLAQANSLFQSRWHNDACVVLGSAGFVRQVMEDRGQPAIPEMPNECFEVPMDFDNDGDLDRVWGCDGDHPGVRNWAERNNGDGTFTRIDAGDFDDIVDHTYDLVAFDADADGDQDLAQAAYSNSRLFHNDGTGFFTLVEAGDFDESGGGETIDASDADGDGDQDLTLDGATFLYENLHVSGSVLSPAVAPLEIYPGSLLGWGKLTVDEVLVDLTTITYDVLDPATGRPLPGFAGLRPDAAGQISLAGIDPFWQRSIQLRANLADLHTGSDYEDRSPQLCGWQVSFDMETGVTPTPTPSPTSTRTTTPTASPTPTCTPTYTPTPSPSPIASPTAALTPSPTPTATPPAPSATVYLPLIVRKSPVQTQAQVYLPLILK